MKDSYKLMPGDYYILYSEIGEKIAIVNLIKEYPKGTQCVVRHLLKKGIKKTKKKIRKKFHKRYSDLELGKEVLISKDSKLGLLEETGITEIELDDGTIILVFAINDFIKS